MLPYNNKFSYNPYSNRSNKLTTLGGMNSQNSFYSPNESNECRQMRMRIAELQSHSSMLGTLWGQEMQGCNRNYGNDFSNIVMSDMHLKGARIFGQGLSKTNKEVQLLQEEYVRKCTGQSTRF